MLAQKSTSLYNPFSEILSEIAHEVNGFDINSAISKRDMKVNSQAFRLPFSIRKRWETHFMAQANWAVLEVIEKSSPDMVLVCNSFFLLPETCIKIRQRSKLVFFYG